MSRSSRFSVARSLAVPMAVQLGPATFSDHVSLELFPQKWTDTFVFPVRHDRALPPWNYAEVVKTVIRSLKRSRISPSLWVPVMAPGKWYFDEMKFALRKASIPVAVTRGYIIPQILDFSKPPGIYNGPCFVPAPRDPLPVFDLTETALRSLLIMARFTAAYTNEVECSMLLTEYATRCALKKLEELGYVEYHANDGEINCHLVGAKHRLPQHTRQGLKRNGDYWPYWRIRRSGISAALRAWGVPVGEEFSHRLERTRLLNSHHRRRTRQWPKWLSLALPHAEIYAGWNEVSIPGLRTRPDALAWGKIHGVETLFWLEVESGNVSRQRMRELTVLRWTKAKRYADVAEVHLIFVVLGRPWAQETVRTAFTDIAGNSGVIIAGWNRLNFGKLPFPKWGEVVSELSSWQSWHHMP